MNKKEIRLLIVIIHMVSKRYPKDQDVQMICNALEKILVKVEQKNEKQLPSI